MRSSSNTNKYQYMMKKRRIYTRLRGKLSGGCILLSHMFLREVYLTELTPLSFKIFLTKASDAFKLKAALAFRSRKSCEHSRMLLMKAQMQQDSRPQLYL